MNENPLTRDEVRPMSMHGIHHMQYVILLLLFSGDVKVRKCLSGRYEAAHFFYGPNVLDLG